MKPQYIYLAVLYFADGREPYLIDADMDETNLPDRVRITLALYPEAKLKLRKVNVAPFLFETEL